MAGLQGFDLYTDNYYTSPMLYHELYKHGINACGTVRTNRKDFPKELVYKRKTGIQRGFYDYRSKGPLLSTVWFDKRFIYFVSTLHVAEDQSGPTYLSRHHQDGTEILLKCPPLLVGLSAIHAQSGQG